MKSQRVYHVIRGQRVIATEPEFVRAIGLATRSKAKLFEAKPIETLLPGLLPHTRAEKRKRRVA